MYAMTLLLAIQPVSSCATHNHKSCMETSLVIWSRQLALTTNPNHSGHDQHEAIAKRHFGNRFM